MQRYSGIGFSGLLGLLFISLKLTNVITWSWWWVLAPFWAVPALFVLIIFAVVIAQAIIDVGDN
jgi:hypothetical protein